MDPTKKRICHVKRLAEAAVPLKHHWETPGPGRGKKLPPKQRVQSGNRSQYLVNRIARDRPDILERMKAGEFAFVRQAAIAAGIIGVGRRQRIARGEVFGDPAAERRQADHAALRRLGLDVPADRDHRSALRPAQPQVRRETIQRHQRQAPRHGVPLGFRRLDPLNHPVLAQGLDQARAREFGPEPFIRSWSQD